MHMELTGERVIMRVFVGERDKFQGKPLYEAIVELLRSRHYAGATVLRGIVGFGASSRLHTDRFIELAIDLPIVIECVETRERIDAVLPEIDAMLGGGLVSLERVEVLVHRGSKSRRED
jgi:uncharacterized protein